jgi:histidine triad (HIT) family protein
MMPDCLFCKIVRGELDSETLYRSDGVVAFRDINPAAPSHVLVVPTEHVASANELSRAHGEVLGEIFEVVREIASQEELDNGWRVVTNVGSDAGQAVHHLHFHLIGGRRMSWPPG